MPNKSFSLSFTKKIKRFSKTISPDPDKSISIRSFILGCICEDISQAKNVLESEDVHSTIECLRKLKFSKFSQISIPKFDKANDDRMKKKT